MNAAELLALKQRRETSVPFDLGGDARAVFHVRSLSRVDYRNLLDAHPPRNDDEDWNEETFPPALIAACVFKVEVQREGSTDEIDGLTVEEATEMWQEWEAGLTQVATACWQLNEQAVGVGFISPGFEQMIVSGLSSAIATIKDSPTQSS